MKYEGKSFKEVHDICQPEGGGNLPMRIGRYVSMPLTLLCLKLGISANSVSFARFFVGLFGILLIATGQYWWMIAGLLIFHFAIILDYVDGEIFRYITYKTGKKDTILKGHWLDKVIDNSYRPLLLFAAGIGCAVSQGGDYRYLILGGAGAILIMLDLLIKSRTPLALVYKKQMKYLEETGGAVEQHGKWMDAFLEPWRINNPVTLYWWFLAFGYLHIFLIIYVPLLMLQLIKTVYSQWKVLCEFDKKILGEMYGEN